MGGARMRACNSLLQAEAMQYHDTLFARRALLQQQEEMSRRVTSESLQSSSLATEAPPHREMSVLTGMADPDPLSHDQTEIQCTSRTLILTSPTLIAYPVGIARCQLLSVRSLSSNDAV